MLTYLEIIKRKFSPLQWLYLGLTTGCYVAAIALYTKAELFATRMSVAGYVLIFILLGAFVIVVVELLAPDRNKYLYALVAHFALSFFAVLLTAGAVTIEMCLISALLLGICLYNPHPVSLLIAALVLFVLLAARSVTLAVKGYTLHTLLVQGAEIGIINAVLALLCSFMVHYRERCIDSNLENDRLDGLVDRLSRTNLEYQEYARSIEAASTEAERKRITRDIHDIVGYTLTNIITIMEAVTDIMRVNPLGVSSLVRSARENAEEGLGRIREALHILREQPVVYPKGREALERMITIFTRATGVAVDFELPGDYRFLGDEIEDTIYHIVQESMLNSFRHGKASHVRIFITRSNSEIRLLVRDNGSPGGEFKEDIGLSGMRERLSALGGKLNAHRLKDGFEVGAEIPAVGAISHE